MLQLQNTLPALVIVAIFGLATADKLATSMVSKIMQLTKEDNVIIAPELLRDGLLQLYLWSSGETAAEINKFLQLGSISRDELMDTPYDKYVGTDLRFFVSKDLSIISANRVPTLFANAIEKIDFKDTTAALSRINNWIADRTDSHITKVVDHIPPGTQLMTVSAMSFKRRWSFKFNKAKKAFFYGNQRTVKVDTMSHTGKFRLKYIEQLDANVLQLPIPDVMVSMLVIQPRKQNDINNVVKNLAQIDSNQLNLQGIKERIKIFLPKFKLQYKTGYKHILQQLGIKTLFRRAELTELTDYRGKISIEEIIQTTVVEINEKGSTASASERNLSPAKGKLKIFRVNHPFIFLVMMENRIYFAGRVNSLG